MEDARNNAEVVIDATNLCLIRHISFALATLVQILPKLLDQRPFSTRGLRIDRDVAFGHVSGRNNVGFGVAPNIAEDLFDGIPHLGSRLNGYRHHYAPTS